MLNIPPLDRCFELRSSGKSASACKNASPTPHNLHSPVILSINVRPEKTAAAHSEQANFRWQHHFLFRTVTLKLPCRHAPYAT